MRRVLAYLMVVCSLAGCEGENNGGSESFDAIDNFFEEYEALLESTCQFIASDETSIEECRDDFSYMSAPTVRSCFQSTYENNKVEMDAFFSCFTPFVAEATTCIDEADTSDIYNWEYCVVEMYADEETCPLPEDPGSILHNDCALFGF